LILRKKKNQVIRGQKYEEAKLRDVEKQLNATLEIARKDSDKNRQLVTEEDVASVVSMIITVHKVSENENKNFLKCVMLSKVKLLDKMMPLLIVRSIQRGRVGMKDPNRPIFSGILIGILVLVKLNLLNN
jgi:ATP-dependent Clp protease ATP-binding subunit ClpC